MSASTQALALTSVLWLQPSPCGPRHTLLGESDWLNRDTLRPWTATPVCFSRTRETPQLCCSSQSVTTIEIEQSSARQCSLPCIPWNLRHYPCAVGESNWLILAATDVLFHESPF
ncbi:MAG UNVERIFIED_CONTAM: hypothetical protein LVR18_45450 [Planctomycetaceae bacterium]